MQDTHIVAEQTIEELRSYRRARQQEEIHIPGPMMQVKGRRPLHPCLNVNVDGAMLAEENAMVIGVVIRN